MDTIIIHNKDGTVHEDELVRCKDCMYRDKERIDKNMIWCRLHRFGRPEDHFCADAQKHWRDI